LVFLGERILCLFLVLEELYVAFCAAIVLKKGSDAWWYMTTEELLPDRYRDKASEYRKGTDTMDVWFDSGILFSLFLY
jgi:isoleucyl-tRNA synthetase